MASTPYSKMFDVEVVGGDQRTRLAEMLRANALNAPQGQMVGGWYVPPSWSQNLAHLANTAVGVFGGIAAEDAEREALKEDIQKYTAARQAQALRKTIPQAETPEQPMISPMYPSTPAAGRVEGGEFRAMKTGGMDGMPTYGVTQQQPQPVVDPNDVSQYKSRGFQKVLQQQQLAQLLEVPKYTQHIDTPQGRVLISDTGQTYQPMLGGKALYSTTETPRAFERGDGGVWTPNVPIQQYEYGKASAGAARNTVINAGPKALNTELGKGLGEQILSQRNAAQKAFAANTQLDSLEKAVPNAIVGTGADARLDLARLGETVGIGGKNNAERLRNTATLLQGFAQNELTAAEAMRGQGQITEGERAIIRRMAAGDQNMTATELQTGFGVLRKANNFKIAQHEQNVANMQRDPNARELYPYIAAPLTGYPVEVPQQPGAQQPAAAPKRGGAVFRGYVGQQPR